MSTPQVLQWLNAEPVHTKRRWYHCRPSLAVIALAAFVCLLPASLVSVSDAGWLRNIHQRRVARGVNVFPIFGRRGQPQPQPQPQPYVKPTPYVQPTPPTPPTPVPPAPPPPTPVPPGPPTPPNPTPFGDDASGKIKPENFYALVVMPSLMLVADNQIQSSKSIRDFLTAKHSHQVIWVDPQTASANVASGVKRAQTEGLPRVLFADASQPVGHRIVWSGPLVSEADLLKQIKTQIGE